jgi:hypothetical protein
MASIGKLTWFVLLTAWFSAVGTVAFDTLPDEPPALLRVSDTPGPHTKPALVAMPLQDVQWRNR